MEPIKLPREYGEFQQFEIGSMKIMPTGLTSAVVHGALGATILKVSSGEWAAEGVHLPADRHRTVVQWLSEHVADRQAAEAVRLCNRALRAEQRAVEAAIELAALKLEAQAAAESARIFIRTGQSPLSGV